MRKLELTKGYAATVDDGDFDRLSMFKWYAMPENRADGSVRVYALRKVRKPGGGWTTQLLHRAILCAPEGLQVDHINGDPLDNKRENLRLCTNAENQHNQRIKTGGASRFKGVSWHKPCAKWMASIKLNGKRKHLGLFTVEIEAARAYDAAASKHYGTYARTNCPVV